MAKARAIDKSNAMDEAIVNYMRKEYNLLITHTIYNVHYI